MDVVDALVPELGEKKKKKKASTGKDVDSLFAALEINDPEAVSADPTPQTAAVAGVAMLKGLSPPGLLWL